MTKQSDRLDMWDYPLLSEQTDEQLKEICLDMGLSPKGIRPTLINKILNKQMKNHDN